MDSPSATNKTHNENPGPSSQAANICDAAGTEGEWADDVNDEIDSEHSTDDADDMEFFDFSEDTQSGFQGMICRYFVVYEVSLHFMLISNSIEQMLRMD